MHLSGQAEVEPEADDRFGEAHQPAQIPGLRRPVHRGPQVIQIGRQPRDPGLRLSTGETRVRPPRQSDVELQVAATHDIGIVQLGQAPPGIGPDGLQQPVAGPALTGGHLHQRLLDQPGDQAEHGGAVEPRPAHHRLGGIQLERPGEHRQPRQRQPLRVAEQVVAPVQGGLQRALTRRRPPHPAGQQPEPVRQPGRDLARRQHPHPRRRQLERQRDPVQPPADLGHRRRGVVADPKVRGHLPGPHLEQPRRVRGRDRAGGPGIGMGHRQPGDLEGRLTLDDQRHAAGGQHVQPRTRRRQLADQRRARLHHVLAVVEHDQQVPGTELLGERVRQRLLGSRVDAHRPPNGRRDQPGVAHPLQVHPARPVGKPRRHLPGDLHRQPRLAAAPRPGQRHHPGRRDQVGHRRPFTPAADERRDPDGQPAPHHQGLYSAPRSPNPPPTPARRSASLADRTSMVPGLLTPCRYGRALRGTDAREGRPATRPHLRRPRHFATDTRQSETGRCAAQPPCRTDAAGTSVAAPPSSREASQTGRLRSCNRPDGGSSSAASDPRRAPAPQDLRRPRAPVRRAGRLGRAAMCAAMCAASRPTPPSSCEVNAYRK